MGLYNFQPRFVPYILDGTKTHTIRANRKNPDKPGNTLHLYTGLRHKGARLLKRVTCVRVEPIRIAFMAGGVGCFAAATNYQVAVLIDGVHLSPDEKDELAWRDGFREGGRIPGSFELMVSFWTEKNGLGTQPFDGQIIHWVEKRAAPAKPEAAAIARASWRRPAPVASRSPQARAAARCEATQKEAV